MTAEAPNWNRLLGPESSDLGPTGLQELRGLLALNRGDIGWQQLVEVNRILVLEPRLTVSDVLCLDDSERDTSAVNLTPREPVLSLDRLDPPECAGWTKAASRYTYHHLGKEIEVPTDESLPSPIISIVADSIWPLIKQESGITPEPGTKITYQFEFDSTPDFDSPNLLRYPPLCVDRTCRLKPNNLRAPDISYNVFAVQIRDWVKGPELRLPYSVLAFRLPLDWDKLTYDELVKLAHSFSFGTSDALQCLEQMFNYVRHIYVWGNETYSRGIMDVFQTRIGQCGHVNNLLAAMAEIRNLRTRSVSGFSPRARVMFPGGGHTAIEVYNAGIQSWMYVDPYLDIFLPGHSAENLDLSPKSQQIIFAVNKKYRSLFGDGIALQELFKYRKYFDRCGRLDPATMLQLGNSEQLYGTNWKVNSVRQPDTQDIFGAGGDVALFARGRYVYSRIKEATYLSGPGVWLADDSVRASPWGTAASVKKRYSDWIAGRE